VTSPAEEVRVECPRCGTIFIDHIRRSINVSLDPELADPEYLDAAGSVTCPKCHHREPFTDVLLARF
jgi:CpXC protein